MARLYAGILGCLAMATAVVDGLVSGRHPDGVLLTAWISLWAFAGVGCVAGWIAARCVEESVGAAVAAELAQRRPAEGETSGKQPGDQ